MPFQSKAQSRLMYAVANNPKLAKQLGIPTSTAKEMIKKGSPVTKGMPEKVKKK